MIFTPTDPDPDPDLDLCASYPEGWAVFQNTDDEHEPFELNRLDDPAGTAPWLGMAGPVFADDIGAWEHVISRAGAGSGYHNQVLLFLARESPGEIVHITMTLAGLPCPCVPCTEDL